METPTNSNSWYYPKIPQGFHIVLTFIALSFITGMLVSVGNLSGTKLMMDILMLLGYLVAAGGTLLIATQVKTRVYASKPAFRNHTVTSGDYVIILMLTVLVIIVIDPLTNLFPVPDRYHDLFETLFSKSIPAFITAVILAPLLEELIFRGIILEGFLRNYSPVKAILWTNFLFGVAHMNPWQFIGAFFMGIFISWVYYKTRNITLSVFIHFVNNLISYLFLYFTDKPVMEASLRDVFTGSSGYYTLIIVSVLLLGLFFMFSARIFPVKTLPGEFNDQ
ncbi:MAG: CPBP family intramembrane metalloprotease [Bacteroidales bacterium]|nr:CPBP family intramembrane metalloprotease [Bacteroidales bacterium]